MGLENSYKMDVVVIFQNNNSESFINKFDEFINDNEKKEKKKKFLAKKETKNLPF